MDEKELVDIKQKTLEIAQRDKGMDSKLTQEAVKKLDSDKASVKSSKSRLR